jgi:hypothetical protein
MNEQTLMNEIAMAISFKFRALVLRANAGDFIGPSGNRIKGMPAGTSDLIVCLPPLGRFVGIEVKTEKGRQSEQQASFQAAVQARGGIYVLARSVDEAIAGVKQAAESEHGAAIARGPDAPNGMDKSVLRDTQEVAL